MDSANAVAPNAPPIVPAPARAATTAVTARATHWVEYGAEALCLGLFMISACTFATLLDHPASPLRHAIPSGDVRRVLIGMAMGLTAIALIYSPWGKRSGAHMNPSVTLAFLRLGRVAPRDAVAYTVAQFAGGTLGVLLCAALFGRWLGDPAVNFAVTVPGMTGIVVAFLAELGMAFGILTVVLNANASPRWMKITGVFAGITVASYISLLGPLSGMSMNPARSFASSVVAHVWTAWWIYFLAPPLGMLLAVEWHRRRHPRPDAGCAKYHHADGVRCIFCEYQAATRGTRAGEPAS